MRTRRVLLRDKQMQITVSLNKKINQAVRTSMQIEGYQTFPVARNQGAGSKPSWNSTVSKYQFSPQVTLPSRYGHPENRLGITEAGTITRSRRVTVATSVPSLLSSNVNPAPASTEAYFKSLQQRTFETLYDWAGVYRTVDMSKGSSLFCRAAYLEQESKRIFSQLEKEGFLHQANWQPEKFAERLAYYQSELIALHPFYELNGRITRLFFDLIAVANGYAPIDYQQSLARTADE